MLKRPDSGRRANLEVPDGEPDHPKTVENGRFLQQDFLIPLFRL
jgi:hypothetical protein